MLFDETPDKSTGSLGGGIENVQVVWFQKTYQKLTFVPYCSKVSCELCSKVMYFLWGQREFVMNS